MSSPDQVGESDEASRKNPEASSSSLNNEKLPKDNKEEVMKRAAAKKLIERYFYQLTDGCGNPDCDNKYCASSGELKPLTPDEAAAQAIQLFSQDARLCERHPNKIARKQVNVLTTKKSNGSKDVSVSNDLVPTNDISISETSENSKNNIKYHCCKYRQNAKPIEKNMSL